MNPQENTPTVNIQDYLLDESPSALSKATNPYEVLHQDKTDFIILQKKVKSEKQLVVLMSQGLFYFKDGKSKIEEITVGKLKAFLRDLSNDSIILDQVHWIKALHRQNVERMHSIITSATYVAMCRANVATDFNNLYSYSELWEKNPELFTELYSHIADIPSLCNRDCIATGFEIEQRFGYDEAIYFVKMLGKSGITQYSSALHRYAYNSLEGFFQLFEAPYSLSFRRLVEYAFIDAPAQGIAIIDDSFWKMYANYLKMQTEIYGEIQDFYPAYLKTAHDVLTLNAELVTESTESAEHPAEITELAHKGKVYSIIVPETSKQIAEEGINLSHCMGTNASKNDNHVLFLRKSQSPKESLVTLQLSAGRISQAVGQHRRRITDDERSFLEKWGKEKGVQIAA
jgi:hypothetical protein